MENRYLLRAKKDTGEWGIGYVSRPHCTDTEKGIKSFYFFEATKRGVYDQCIVLADTICQCTGLKDKNGKLIWENDIVNCPNVERCGYIGWNESEAGFYFNALLEDGGFEEEHIYDSQDCMEVIGNTFDNPELLEV